MYLLFIDDDLQELLEFGFGQLHQIVFYVRVELAHE